jgi:hypothetical protein
MSIEELYLDTKLNYRLYLLAEKMIDRKKLDGMVIPKDKIEKLLTKMAIFPEKMAMFIEMLPEDYWSAQ